MAKTPLDFYLTALRFDKMQHTLLQHVPQQIARFSVEDNSQHQVAMVVGGYKDV